MNKKSVVATSIIVSILLLGTIVSSYAYFQSRLATGSSTPTTVKANTISGLTFSAGSNINLLVNQTNMASGSSDLAASTEATVTLKARNDASDNYNYKTCLNISSNNFVHSSVSSTETSYGKTKNIIDYKTMYSDASKFILDTSSSIISGLAKDFHKKNFTIPSEYLNKPLTFSAEIKKISPVDIVYLQAFVNGTDIRASNRQNDEFYKLSINFTPTTTNDYVYITYGSTSGTIYVKNVQLEVGSAVTEYEPYGYIASPELVLTVIKNGTTVLTQDITTKTGQVCVPTTNGGTTLTHNISASANSTTTDTWKATITFKNLSTNQNINTNKGLNANFVFTKI